MSDWFYQPAVRLLGHWPYVFQHLCGIAAVNIWNIFFVLTASSFVCLQYWVYCSLPIVRKLPLHFDVLIWPPSLSQECLNLPAFFPPVVLIAGEVAASRELVRSAHKFSISSRCFLSVQLIHLWYSICLTDANGTYTVGFLAQMPPPTPDDHDASFRNWWLFCFALVFPFNKNYEETGDTLF